LLIKQPNQLEKFLKNQSKMLKKEEGRDCSYVYIYIWSLSIGGMYWCRMTFSWIPWNRVVHVRVWAALHVKISVQIDKICNILVYLYHLFDFIVSFGRILFVIISFTMKIISSTGHFCPGLELCCCTLTKIKRWWEWGSIIARDHEGEVLASMHVRYKAI